jgi:hypothetical protein
MGAPDVTTQTFFTVYGGSMADTETWLPVPSRMARGMRRCVKEDETIAPDLITSGAFLFTRQTVERSRLEAAVSAALSNATALRSRYRYTPDRGVEYQEVEDFAPQLQFIRLENTPGDDTDAVIRAAKSVLDGQDAQSFDMTSGRLFKVVCVEGNKAFALVVAAVHVVCDGASFEMVLEDIGEAYSRGESTVLLEMPRRPTLAEVAREEAAFHQSARAQEVAAAWRARLPHGMPEMMIRHTKPWQERPLLGVALRESVTGDAYEAFINEATTYRATPFMLATAKFLLAVRAAIVEGELAFVSPMPGRYVSSAQNVVGYFSCPLPVLVEPADEGPLEMLKAVRRGVLWSMQHDGLTFSDIIEATSPLSPPEGEKRRTIFISGAPPRRFSLAGAQPQRIQAANTDQRVLYDLSLWIGDAGTHLELDIVFSKEWIAQEQVQQWFQRVSQPLLGTD